MRFFVVALNWVSCSYLRLNRSAEEVVPVWSVHIMQGGLQILLFVLVAIDLA